jgi:uncharacterized delta-60 repeat protein
MKKYLVFILLILFLPLFSQNLVIDSSFGTNGRVVTDFGQDDSIMASLVFQTDGKIIACGSYYNGITNQIALSRYFSDGAIDTSFGINGIVLTPVGTNLENESNAVSVLNNGKIVVVGREWETTTGYDLAIVRYNTDGSLDSTFSGDGILIYDFNNFSYRASDVEIQTDSKIIIGGTIYDNSISGYSDYFVTRFDENGNIDLNFGTNGSMNYNVGTINQSQDSSEDYLRTIKLLPNGKIILVGNTNYLGNSGFALMRLNTNGMLDTSFGTNGKAFTFFIAPSDPSSIQILNDNSIVVSGTYFYNNDNNQKIALAKYLENGVPDLSYGVNGKVVTDFNLTVQKGFVFSSLKQENEKIIVSGFVNNETADFFMARYNTNGSLDTTFGLNGFLNSDYGTNEGGFTSITQADGKIIVGGITVVNSSSDFTLLRFQDESLSNAEIDNSYFSISPNPLINEINIHLNKIYSQIQIDLYDVRARLLLSSSYTDSKEISIPIKENLNKGNYFLKITTDQKSKVFKLVKQ